MSSSPDKQTISCRIKGAAVPRFRHIPAEVKEIVTAVVEVVWRTTALQISVWHLVPTCSRWNPGRITPTRTEGDDEDGAYEYAKKSVATHLTELLPTPSNRLPFASYCMVRGPHR